MPLEVIWHAPVYDPSGYASCARDYIFALHEAGVKVKVQPVTFWSPIATPAVTGEKLALLKSLENTVVSSTCPRVNHFVPDLYKHLDPKRNEIGYTVFETSTIPSHWVDKMFRMAHILCPCNFNVETFENGGFNRNRMSVIPHIVDTNFWNSENYSPLDLTANGKLPKKEFYFLSIMDVTHRKGWDILLRAYLREFEGNDNVGLVFKGYFGGVSENHKKNLITRLQDFGKKLSLKKPPDIIFYGDILDQMDLPRLYKACNCSVSPHRGGGWELFCSESMAMGMPTIATGWSGNMEFMNKENSYLIDVLEFKTIDDEMTKITPNYKNQKWAEPSEANLRQLMRYVYENRNEAKQKGIIAREHLQKNFNKKVIADKLIEVIKRFS
jgi:glycosyltransferase involved in cell wall biosynthesis